MDYACILLKFLRATKENNFDPHLSSLTDMYELFFSYDHPNYARNTIVHVLAMQNLHQSHTGVEDLFKQNGFIVPSSKNTADITIERIII